jgi:hypothetical protein
MSRKSRASAKVKSRASAKVKSRASAKVKSKKSRVRGKKPDVTLPKTMKIPSKKTKSVQRVKASRADPNMSMSDLEFMAKSLGIPFGGLNKTQLARKINNYF